MAEVTAATFAAHGGVGPPETLTTTARLYTVPGECDALILTGTAAFSAAHNHVYGVLEAGDVSGVTKCLTTRGTSAPFQLSIPRPLNIARGTPWPVIAWAGSGSPVVDSLVVRRGLE